MSLIFMIKKRSNVYNWILDLWQISISFINNYIIIKSLIIILVLFAKGISISTGLYKSWKSDQTAIFQNN